MNGLKGGGAGCEGNGSVTTKWECSVALGSLAVQGECDSDPSLIWLETIIVYY